jgi:hypothetical protein
LTERHSPFARRHALAELAGAFEQGIAVERLEQATDAYLARADVVELIGKDEPRYTTTDLLSHETEPARVRIWMRNWLQAMPKLRNAPRLLFITAKPSPDGFPEVLIGRAMRITTA